MLTVFLTFIKRIGDFRRRNGYKGTLRLQKCIKIKKNTFQMYVKSD